LPERFGVSVPPVASDICRRTVPAPKYLRERRSTAFPHHYTLAMQINAFARSQSCVRRLAWSVERVSVAVAPGVELDGDIGGGGGGRGGGGA